MAASVTLLSSKQASTSGGSRESEVTAFAVVPTGVPSGPTEVITVTPVAKCPIASRSSAGETSVDWASGRPCEASFTVVMTQTPWLADSKDSTEFLPYGDLLLAWRHARRARPSRAGAGPAVVRPGRGAARALSAGPRIQGCQP